jgi:hypothetical protein
MVQKTAAVFVASIAIGNVSVVVQPQEVSNILAQTSVQNGLNRFRHFIELAGSL